MLPTSLNLCLLLPAGYEFRDIDQPELASVQIVFLFEFTLAMPIEPDAGTLR